MAGDRLLEPAGHRCRRQPGLQQHQRSHLATGPGIRAAHQQLQHQRQDLRQHLRVGKQLRRRQPAGQNGLGAVRRPALCDQRQQANHCCKQPGTKPWHAHPTGDYRSFHRRPLGGWWRAGQHRGYGGEPRGPRAGQRRQRQLSGDQPELCRPGPLRPGADRWLLPKR